MKKIILKLSAVSIVAAIFICMISFNAFSADSVTVTTGNLSVNATGSVKAKPDIALVRVGVVTQGATTAIQSENNALMTKVISAVKTAGIDEKDIKTEGYFLQPNYSYEYDQKTGQSKEKFVNYTCTNRIEIKVRDISKAGEILSLAEKSGANEITGVNFTISNPEFYYKQALENAIKECKEKAQVMAKAAGVTLGKPINISENSGYNSYYSNSNINYAPAVAETAANSVSIETGELSISATVTMNYEY